jgi:flagellar basal body P-ring formation protein FlgA
MFPMMHVRLLLSLLAGLSLAAHAQDRPVQDMQLVRQQAASYVLKSARSAFEETAAHVEIGNVDPRLSLPACGRLEFFLPAGTRSYGNGSVGVRCKAPEPWTFYLTFQVVLSGPALVSTRPMSPREPIRPRDVEVRRVRYQGVPGNYLREPEELRGALAARPIPAGTAITSDLLLRAQPVRAGQRVRVLVRGRGFQIAQEGIALNSAHSGDVVRVRTPSGQVIQGLAEPDGSIRVRP